MSDTSLYLYKWVVFRVTVIAVDGVKAQFILVHPVLELFIFISYYHYRYYCHLISLFCFIKEEEK